MTFYFSTILRVTLQDGDWVKLRQTVAIQASCVEVADGLVASIATETCYNDGTRWFDAPPRNVEVLEAYRVSAGSRDVLYAA